MNIYSVYLLFWIFSFIGWIIEVLACSISDRKFVNRGFLIGPYLPIYGFGGTIMLLFMPYKDHPFIVFISALFICSVIEYITSFLMEKLFKVRWWDYSDDSFNINGRVCLRNALAFGALGVVLTKYLYPFFMDLLSLLTIKEIYIIDIILLIITFLDIIISFKAMNSIKNVIDSNIKNLKNIDATSDIKKLINEKLSNNYLQKRLIKTYHLLEDDAKYLYKKISSSYYKKLIILGCIGFIIGFIFSIIYHKYNFIVLFISFSILLSFIIKGRDRK